MTRGAGATERHTGTMSGCGQRVSTMIVVIMVVMMVMVVAAARVAIMITPIQRCSRGWRTWVTDLEVFLLC